MASLFDQSLRRRRPHPRALHSLHVDLDLYHTTPMTANMSQRALHLPIRTLTARNGAQWTCRRCLATEPVSPSQPPMPPPQKKDPSETSNYDPSLPSSQRDYRLTPTDFYLKRHLPQRIPDQYLQHSTSPILHLEEKVQRETVSKHKRIIGVVVSAGKMDKTVKVRLPTQRWNTRIHKVRPPLPSILTSHIALLIVVL